MRRCQKVKQDAAVLGISAADKVEADRSLATFVVASQRSPAERRNLVAAATAAAALAARGMSNPNKGVQARNADALRLKEQVGSVVMGPENWARYITTSAKDTTKGDKPFTGMTTQRLAEARRSDEREGWVFHHAALSVSGWAITDEITYTLPGHTEANPRLHRESLQGAVSEAYHASWKRHSRASNRNKKDQDAGKPLFRGPRKP